MTAAPRYVVTGWHPSDGWRVGTVEPCCDFDLLVMLECRAELLDLFSTLERHLDGTETPAGDR